MGRGNKNSKNHNYDTKFLLTSFNVTMEETFGKLKNISNCLTLKDNFNKDQISNKIPIVAYPLSHLYGGRHTENG